MGILERSRGKLLQICINRRVDRTLPVQVVLLSPDEAIGEQASCEFALKKGKELVVEAVFQEARGQAFTSEPSNWTGTLDEVQDLSLSEVNFFEEASRTISRGVMGNSGLVE